MIDSRYEIIRPLGQGGMGAVYQAYDRLTGQEIALKQVLADPTQPPATFYNRDRRIALTHEFQTLASLRHPNIIPVQDYGFDAQIGPYFTMRLLKNSKDLLTAAFYLSPNDKVRLLCEVLQALIYLHHRGIIHRDLKPGNILVDANGVVNVLDFGVAMDAAHTVSAAGTPAYMAPETLLNHQVSPLSDLYAVGVMGYQMFAGRHPFSTQNQHALIADLQADVTPDMRVIDDSLRAHRPRPTVSMDAPTEILPQTGAVNVPAAGASKPPIAASLLTKALARLLAKNPADRYQSANSALADLYGAINQPIPRENIEIRESFLQTARFVGRETEMNQLREAVNTLRKTGTGAAWLVGGESGVGKSRLLDELRIEALVSQVRVVRGQAVEGGGQPYQLWRAPLERLILSATVDDLEAGVLMEVVPAIAGLLRRTLPGVAPLPAQENIQRLHLTILDVFRRQTRPILLLLEDLQWAGGESLLLLRQLLARLDDLPPLLIVASYRDDEQPALPDALPEMRSLPLRRLNPAQIARLSEAMLGAMGTHPDLIELLQRETEGNAFFAVEVLRAMADDAGSLQAIGSVPLPERVLAGGIMQIIERRLRRIDPHWHELLRLAATAGRLIDLAVLDSLLTTVYQADNPAAQREAFLSVCANAAVLRLQDGVWGFDHDKLREGLLADDPARHPLLHRQVAEAIEHAYPSQTAYNFSPVLYTHWRAAGDVQKTLIHGMSAAAHLHRITQPRQALDILTSLADIPKDDEQQLLWLRLMGTTYFQFSDNQQSFDYYQQALGLAETTNDNAQLPVVLNELARTMFHLGDLAASEAYAQRGLALAQQRDDLLQKSVLLDTLGSLHAMRGQFDAAFDYFNQALTVYRALGDTRFQAYVLNNLGNVALFQGDYATARQHYEASLAMSRSINERINQAQALGNLGYLAAQASDFPTARRYQEESLAIHTETGNLQGISDTLLNLGSIAEAEGDLTAALSYYERSLHVSEKQVSPYSVAYAQVDMAFIHLAQGDTATARQSLASGFAVAVSQGNAILIVRGLLCFARLQLLAGEAEQALEIAALADSHPASEDDLKALRLAPLRDLLAQSEVYAAAWERGLTRDLADTASAVLAALQADSA